MKITLLAIGKNGYKFVDDGINEYVKRLKNYCNFELVILPDLKNTKSLSQAQIKTQEASKFLAQIPKSAYVILLDENGKHFSSEKFAESIQNYMNQSMKDVVFVIGGPYGFDDQMYEKSNLKLSFSQMTLSHQLIRLVFVEQLYRAFTILRGEPYHHQ